MFGHHKIPEKLHYTFVWGMSIALPDDIPSAGVLIMVGKYTAQKNLPYELEIW